MQTLSAGTWFLLTLTAIVAVGVVVLLRSLREISTAVAFTEQYRTHVSVFVNHADFSAYEWLTLNVNRMQTQLGSQGLMTFKPPFANHMIHNYPIVLNILPELRTCLTDDLLSRNLLHQYRDMLDDALLRHQGSLIERRRDALSALKNPFAWVTTGISTVLSAPLWFLAAVGVIPLAFASRIAASRFYRVLSGLIATVGFVSAIVGLVTGWDQFMTILRKVLPSGF